MRAVKVSTQFVISLITFVSVISLCWWISSFALYQNCPKADIRSTKPTDFNVSNARNMLTQMTNFGVKNSGSNANENMTVQFIVETIEKIIKSPQNSKNVEYELQVVSGTFLLNFVESFISVYDKVQNIVVRVGQSSDCLLINCHFDSALSSPGASDDLISCANMLEVLRIVSLEATDARNCLIFLFNGAEENILQASHGFTTKHPWFKDVRGVVNLEASGSGGNQILFQSGPGTSWLLYLYRDSVPFPYGSAAAQDLFQSGLIPSDTDYRIFRDYGNVSGLDLAFFTNGYVYHTSDDTDTRIDDCTISKAGINLLALTKAFLVQSHFYSTEQKLAYFEVVSTYFFVLPQSLISSLCLGGLVFALCSTYYGVMGHNYMLRMRYNLIYCTAVFLVIATFLASFGINYLLSSLFHALSLRMTWFALNFNLALYTIPPFLVVLSFHHLNALIWNSNDPLFMSSIVLQAFALLNALVALYMSFYQLGSTIYPLLFSTFLSLFGLISRTANHVLSVVVLFVPILTSVDVFYRIMTMFVPLMGRTGTFVPSDVPISLFMAFFVTLVSTLGVYVFYCKFQLRSLVFWIIFIYLCYVVVIYSTPLGFPYSSSQLQPRKKRVLYNNICRQFSGTDGGTYLEDCGVYMMPFDSYGGGTKVVMNESEAYYGYPFYLPFRRYIGELYKLEGWNDRSLINFNKSFRVVDRTSISYATTRFTIEIEVTDHCSFVILPVHSILTRIDLITINETYNLNASGNTFIYYAQGLPSSLFKLSFDVKSPGNSVLAKFAVSWNLLEHSNFDTNSFQEFLKTIPSWIAPTVIRAKFNSIDLN